MGVSTFQIGSVRPPDDNSAAYEDVVMVGERHAQPLHVQRPGNYF
jgi:hypothetical protein